MPEQKKLFILKSSLLQLFWWPLKLALALFSNFFKNRTWKCEDSITGSVSVVPETKLEELWDNSISTLISDGVLETLEDFGTCALNKFFFVASRSTDSFPLFTDYLPLSDLPKLDVIFSHWSSKEPYCAASAQVFYSCFLITWLSVILSSFSLNIGSGIIGSKLCSKLPFK